MGAANHEAGKCQCCNTWCNTHEICSSLSLRHVCRYPGQPAGPGLPPQFAPKLADANLRPILLFDELLNASSIKAHILRGTDILFFRELTGDVYFGEKHRSEDKNTASDLMIYHKYEVERIAHKAYEAAMQRGRKVMFGR